MAIFEPFMMKQIISITCKILRHNFFYDDDGIALFLDSFTDDIAKELTFFEINSDLDTIHELNTNLTTRLHFTCYITSLQLRQTFIKTLNFSDLELNAFESILPKYTGENRYETNSKYQGKNH